MRFVPSGLFALSVIAVSLPAHAETTVEAVVAACTPEAAPLSTDTDIGPFAGAPEASTLDDYAAPTGPYPGGPAETLIITPTTPEPETVQIDPTFQGKQPRPSGENTLLPTGARSVVQQVEVALALPPRFLGGVRRAVIEVTRVAQNGGDSSSSGVSSGCSDAIAQYVAELQAIPGATTAAIEAGLADLVYKLATTGIPSGGGSAVAAAITLAASYSTNGNLKYNAQKLADDVADDQLDSSVGSAGGLTSASLS